MTRWVLAFVGDGAQHNYEHAKRTGEFWVTSNRTPIRQAKPGDKALLYLAGEGFVAEATVVSQARKPYHKVVWASKTPPSFGLSIGEIRTFASPVSYEFPKKGPHPVLGFHPYALRGGFLKITEEGFDDVLLKAAAGTLDSAAGCYPSAVPDKGL